MSAQVIEEFDYQKLMRMHHGCPVSAREAMIKSFALYWKNRSNHIARKRCKSSISIIRLLDDRIKKQNAR